MNLAPTVLNNIVAVAAGGDHFLALSSDGRISAWGENRDGQADVPAGLEGVRAIAAGARHSVALKADGTVVTWGSNLNGQIDVPTGLRDVARIDAGGDASFAMLRDGSAVHWGMFASGAHDVMRVPGFDIVDVSVGDTHLFAVFDDGGVDGFSVPLSDVYRPVAPPTPMPPISSISAGSGFVVGLKGDGTVVAWGRNDFGQASPPPSVRNVKAISAGGGVGLALLVDGTVVGWGSQPTPPLSGVVAVAAGPQSMALREDGSIAMWGRDIEEVTVIPGSRDSRLAEPVPSHLPPVASAQAVRAEVVREYSSIDGARRAQQSFASRSLITEGYAAMGEQWGLHSEDSRVGVYRWLQQGAPIDGLAKIDYGDGLTHWEVPLLTAFIDGRDEAADALLERGAIVDAPNAIVFRDGSVLNHTALHMLCQRGINAGAKRLIAAGADVNRRTTLGTTPLHFAAGKDNYDLVAVLLRAGANPRVREFNADYADGWGDLPVDQAGPQTRKLLR